MEQGNLEGSQSTYIYGVKSGRDQHAVDRGGQTWHVCRFSTNLGIQPWKFGGTRYRMQCDGSAAAAQDGEISLAPDFRNIKPQGPML